MNSLQIRQSTVSNIVLLTSFTFMLIGHNLYDRKMLFLNFLIFLLFNLKSVPSLFIRIISNPSIFIVISYCMLSVTWSSWSYQSMEESIIQLMLVLTCMMAANIFSTKTIFSIFKNSSYIVIAINLISIPILLGDAFGDSGMVGIYGHKNNFGLVMALCLIVLTFDYLDSRSKITLYFYMIAMAFLLLSMSKTSIVLYFLAILVSIIISRSKVNCVDAIFASSRVILFCSLIIAVCLVVVYKHEVLDNIYYNISEDFMTGRGKLWITMLMHAESNIIYGFGFNSVWGKSEFSEIYFTQLSETAPIWVDSLSASDSGYVDLLLSLGVVGFSIFTYYILSTFISLIYIKSSRYFTVMFSLFFFVSLHNITETSFLLSTNILWFVTILTSFLIYNEETNLSAIDVKIIKHY